MQDLAAAIDQMDKDNTASVSCDTISKALLEPLNLQVSACANDRVRNKTCFQQHPGVKKFVPLGEKGYKIKSFDVFEPNGPTCS